MKNKSILDQLDDFFAQKSDGEKYMYFLLPALLFGFLAFYLLYGKTSEPLEREKTTRTNLKNNINNTQRSIMSLEGENRALPGQISSKKESYTKREEVKGNIFKEKEKLSFFKFDLTKWVTLYKKTPQIAKKYGLKIIALENKISINGVETKEKLETLKSLPNTVDINLKMILTMEGKFINVVRFINSFEAMKEIVQIDNFTMNDKEFVITIDVYGADI